MTDAPAVVRLPELCTFATRDDVRERGLQALTERQRAGLETLVIDASQVEAFDAAALGVIVLLEKRAREAGLRLVMRAPTPVVLAALRTAGLTGDVVDDSAPT